MEARALILAALVCAGLAMPSQILYKYLGLAPDDCVTPEKDCGSTDVKPSHVTVEGCCSTPCIAKRGTTIVFTFNITSDKDYTGLNQSVCALLGPACVKFPDFTFGDVCSLVKPACPIKEGITYNVTVPIHILSDFPDITTTAKWTISDTSGNMVTCFEVPVKVE